MKMWQTSKASLLADRQLQLRLRTHWRSLSANSFPESTTESKVKPNQCSNFATQSCNHHHGPLSRQTSATRMNCAANASLSALSWRIRAVNFGYFAGFKCCHCDHGIRRNNGWNTLVKHQPEQSAVQCYEYSPNQCLPRSVHKPTTFTPCSGPTFPRLESLAQANSNKTSLPTRLCLPLLCFGLFFSGVAVAPRQPNWPPWLKDSWNNSWTWSWGNAVAASQAILAVTATPDVTPWMGSSSWAGTSSGNTSGGGHSGTRSSSNGSWDAVEGSYSKPKPGGRASPNSSSNSPSPRGVGAGESWPWASSCLATRSGVWFDVYGHTLYAKQARQPGVGPSRRMRP